MPNNTSVIFSDQRYGQGTCLTQGIYDEMLCVGCVRCIKERRFYQRMNCRDV